MSFLDMALAHSAQWSQILDGLRNFTHIRFFQNSFQIVETFGLVTFMKKLPDLIIFFTRDFGNFLKKNWKVQETNFSINL